MTLHVKRPLRVPAKLTDEHSPAVDAVAEKVRADVEERRGAEYAEWWAGRVADNPVLRNLFAGGNGARRCDLPGGAA